MKEVVCWVPQRRPVSVIETEILPISVLPRVTDLKPCLTVELRIVSSVHPSFRDFQSSWTDPSEEIRAFIIRGQRIGRKSTGTGKEGNFVVAIGREPVHVGIAVDGLACGWSD